MIEEQVADHDRHAVRVLGWSKCAAPPLPGSKGSSQIGVISTGWAWTCCRAGIWAFDPHRTLHLQPFFLSLVSRFPLQPSSALSSEMGEVAVGGRRMVRLRISEQEEGKGRAKGDHRRWPSPLSACPLVSILSNPVASWIMTKGRTRRSSLSETERTSYLKSSCSLHQAAILLRFLEGLRRKDEGPPRLKVQKLGENARRTRGFFNDRPVLFLPVVVTQFPCRDLCSAETEAHQRGGAPRRRHPHPHIWPFPFWLGCE